MNLQTQDLLSTKVSLKDLYFKSLLGKILIGFLLLGLLLLVFFISISFGSYAISLREVFKGLFLEGENSYIIWNIRLTRSISAILTGAALGVAGAVMQNILRNPLASPFTLGVSQGAAFGAAFAIILLEAGQLHSVGTEGVTVFRLYTVAFFAFLGALLTVSIILILSFIRNMTPEAIILSGVALSSLFGSATMFLQYFASDIKVAATVFWTFGDLGKAGWIEIKVIFLVFLLSFLYFIFHRWNYNALSWGDEIAKSLGVNVKFLRMSSMFFAALVVSICTAFLGIIGFVGLISPHIVRLIVGNDYRFLIPYSALFGAFLLTLSDLIARLILAPVILPVGIITSFAGAPMFFYLLIKKRKF